MTDLNKLRSEFESDLAEHLIERDANGCYINCEIQHYWDKYRLKAQVKELKAELEKSKAQAVPETHILIPKEPNDEIIASMKLTWWESDCAHIMKTSVAKSIYAGIVKASESGAER